MSNSKNDNLAAGIIKVLVGIVGVVLSAKAGSKVGEIQSNFKEVDRREKVSELEKKRHDAVNR